jgi:hypothetical protein
MFNYSDKGNFRIALKPCLKIEDQFGILPLKLDRSDFSTDVLPFENELLKDVSKDFIAQLLTLPVTSTIIEKHKIFPHKIDILFLKDGFIFGSDYFFNKIPKDFVLLVFAAMEMQIQNPLLLFENSDKLIIYFQQTYEDYVKDTENYLVYKNKYCGKRMWDLNILEKRIVNLLNKDINELSDGVIEVLRYPFNLSSRITEGRTLNELFEKYFGSNFIIPYDMDERKKIFQTAFEELQDYMKDY